MARKRRQTHELETAQDPLMSRVRRARQRGQERRATLLLRDACYRRRGEAKLWTLYGVQCLRNGQLADAEAALSQAVWLRTRSREPHKAATTRQLLQRLRARAA